MTGAEGNPEPIEVTVTHLRMDAPPAHYPPLPMGRQLALLKTRDIPLHFYRYLQDRVGRKWHWVNTLRLDDEVLAAALHGGDRDISVLYLDGAPAGFFDLRVFPPERVDLAFFGMMERAMGQGLGRWFLGAAISAAWAHQPQYVTVQTCTLDHPAALPLYQKMGFAPIGQEKERLQPLTLDERAAILVR